MSKKTIQELRALIPADAPKSGWFRHYKGQRYWLIGVALDESTLEPMVVYHSEDDPDFAWVRLLEEWMELIWDDQGKQVSRYTPEEGE